MRILVISDIHSNLEALEACLAAAPTYDRIFNLGDVVGYGASPNEVIDRCRELGGLLVRGNHDKACSGITNADDFNHIAALAAGWTKKNMTTDNLEWVRVLPQGPIRPEGIGEVQCVHGSPLDEDEYIIIVRDAYQPLLEAEVLLTFFGHTHIQGGFSVANDEWTTLRPMYESSNELETFQYAMNTTSKYLINPGSIGQPRDGDWRAAFAVFDTSEYNITYYRVPYNIEAAQRRIFEAGLPERLGTRLQEGR